MKKVIPATLFFLCIISVSQAQITFEKIFGGPGIDQGRSVQELAEGGYVVAGVYQTDTLDTDVYLVKTDAFGDTLWARIYGDTLYEVGLTVQQTSDSGFIVAAYTSSYGQGSYDLYLIRTDSNGDTLWTKTFGGTDQDYGYGVRQTFDGGFILLGQASSFSGNGVADYYLVKTDANGDSVWTRTYGGPGWDGGTEVRQTADSGYILMGDRTNGNGDYDAYIIKTDANGDTLWTRIFDFGNNSDDYGYSIVQTFDGGYIAAGETEALTGVTTYGFLIRLDSNGDSLWIKTYGNNDYNSASSVIQASDSGFVFTGNTTENTTGWTKATIIKTDQNGDTAWTKGYEGLGNAFGNSIKQTNDGGFIIAGLSYDTLTYIAEVYLLKLDANGDTATLTTGTENLTLPNHPFIYPNPANGMFTIDLKSTSPEVVNINITDAIGNQVYQKNLPTFSNGMINIRLPVVAPGIYFVRIQSKEYSETIKLVVQQ